MKLLFKNYMFGQALWFFLGKKHIVEQKMSLSTKICHFLTKNVIFDQKKGACGLRKAKKNIFSKKKGACGLRTTKKHIFFKKKGACGLFTHTKKYVSKTLINFCNCMDE